jgi:hypothetical protein
MMQGPSSAPRWLVAFAAAYGLGCGRQPGIVEEARRPAVPWIFGNDCHGVRVDLDEKTPYGYSPESALDLLRARDVRLPLYQNDPGFFPSIGFAQPATRPDELTFTFRPTGLARHYRSCHSVFTAASPHDIGIVRVVGTLSAELSRGATFSAPGGLEINSWDGVVRGATIRVLAKTSGRSWPVTDTLLRLDNATIRA